MTYNRFERSPRHYLMQWRVKCLPSVARSTLGDLFKGDR